MKRLNILVYILFFVFATYAQEKKVWTLNECVDYALENNIKLQIVKNTYESGLEDTKQSKSAFTPSLSASIGQSIRWSPFSEQSPQASYSGTYGVNSDFTIFRGGRLFNQLKQSKVQNSIDSLSILDNEIDIRLAIVQAYMQCLYAKESVIIQDSVVKVAEAQRDRAKEMYLVGSISKVDLAQLESQVYNDQYKAVTARTNLDNYKLQLKQLLELDVLEEIEVSSVDASEEEVLRMVPSKSSVYEAALAYLPSLESSKLAVMKAELAQSYAKRGYIPTIGLTASLGTSHSTSVSGTVAEQLEQNFNVGAGVNVSIPIASRRETKTAVNKAKIALETSRLNQEDAKKNILKVVESAYHDAVSAQAQYVSAKEQAKYADQSFELTQEQFNVGMKNTVELIEQKNDLLSAHISLIQAKYLALLNLAVLDIYQGK